MGSFLCGSLCRTFCPESVKFFLRPLVTFFIMIPLALGIIGPLGSWVGQGLGIVLNLVQNYAVWVLPFILVRYRQSSL